MLWIPNQQELAYNGQDVVLVCHIEAYPKSINYWTTAKGDMIISGTTDEHKNNGRRGGIEKRTRSLCR